MNVFYCRDILFPALKSRKYRFYRLLQHLERYFFGFHTRHPVFGAHAQFFKIIQYICFGHYQFGDAVDHTGITQGHQIDPATTPRSSGCSPKFATRFAQPVSGFIFQFCRKGATPYTRTIRFCYANHFSDLLRRNTKPRAYAGRNGIGRSNKRKCSKINIQHAALSSFCQHFFPLAEFFVNEIFTRYNFKSTHKFQRFKKFFFQC